MHITVIGAGAWGTALAIAAAGAHTVRLWARDAQQAARLQAQRVNARYLPGVPLPAALVCDGGDAAALAPTLAHTDLVVIATPMAGLRAWLQWLAAAPHAALISIGLQSKSPKAFCRYFRCSSSRTVCLTTSSLVAIWGVLSLSPPNGPTCSVSATI